MGKGSSLPRGDAEGPARPWGLGRWAQMEQGPSVTLPAGVTGVGVPLLTLRIPAGLPRVLFICPLSDWANQGPSGMTGGQGLG